MVKTQSPSETAELLRPYKVGDIVEGSVVGIGRSAVYLDLAPQGTGIIYGREFLDEKDALKDVKPGDNITAKITNMETDKGYIELSLREAGRELSWEKLKENKENEESVMVKIIGANKGGLLAEIHSTPAFLPVSQLSPEHYPRVENGDGNKILEELTKFVGEELEVQIIDMDAKEGKLILSERSKERARVKELLGSYKVEDVVSGEITGVVDFGAFIKFGKEAEELEGLIHISEIDWQIIDDPSQVLKVGDKVEAKIIDISQGRVSLSLKALKEDPWKGIETKYAKGDVVKGKVTKLNPFGTFIEIEPRIQGLAHISEFGTKLKMEESLHLGKEYTFTIVEVNAPEHRMSLHLESETAAKSENAESGSKS
ncbi:MAG: S1 RNA-binding domain-containing protein [bacterium]|nr:S1 RNA-binding domain-containing protein [bacterium]